jgi:predicted Zn-dependent protease
MSTDPLQSVVDEATFAFTMGDTEVACKLLQDLVDEHDGFAPAWHALAEILFDMEKLPEAAEAGLKAVGLKEDDVHIHTSLSRIFMELGDKETAEKHGARARVLGWKAELAEPEEEDE